MWKIAAPIVVSTASMTLMEFADRIFLARHDALELRAALPAGMLSLTMALFFSTLAGYSGTFVAQYFGAGRKRECARATAQGLWAGLLTWPLMAALIPLGWACFRWAGHEAALAAKENVYFTILMAGGGMMNLNTVLAGFFAGLGDTKTPMRANLAANLLNVVLDYALVFGAWGFPEWGIAGAAAATVASGAFGTAWMAVAYYGRRRLREEYGTLREWRLRIGEMGHQFRFAVAGAVHAVMDTGSFAFFLALTGRLPAAAAAANNIAFSVNSVAFMPLMGMGIAAQILTGQYQGARDSRTAAKAAGTALKMSMAYMGVVCLTFCLFPDAYFALFAGNEGGKGVALADIVETGRTLLLLLGLWGMADGAGIVLSGALKGAGDTHFVLWYSMLANWGLWIPSALWAAWRFGDEALLPLWWTLMGCVVVVGAGMGVRFWRGKWKVIDMIGD